MKTNTAFIDVNKLLKQTNQGRDIYEMILPDLQRDGDDKYKKTLNPFYPDTQPGLSIYKDDKGYWRHFDHGEPFYKGNAIDMAALHYNLDRKTQFAELLRRIVDDLEIDPALVARVGDNIEFIKEWWEDEEGLDIAHSYFSNFGITKDVLKRFAVRAVRKYPIVDEDGKLNWKYTPKDKIMIAYEGIHHTKLYTPGADKNFKFQFVGQKPTDFIFGTSQILTNMHWTKNYNRGPLIITGGEKDVMTLTALGYDAITLNSETASLPSHLEDFLTLYDKVAVLYDLDETGKKQAAKLASEHNFSVCTLPNTLIEKGGKDVSDYIKMKMPVAKLRELIASSEPLASMSSKAVSNNDIPNKKQEVSIQTPSTELTSVPTSDESKTPFLPEEVYALIPQMLKTLSDQFDDRRERDINLLSCITIMSSCFPTIKGIYGECPIGCNINLFISAPASAGKGIMSWSRTLGSGINKTLEEKYKAEYAMYEEDLAKYHSKDKEENMPRPIEPIQKRLFIPANSSCASIYEHLSANEAFGIIFDTEADTLSSTMKNDWGDYSYLLRKAFHHETAELSRRKDREFLRVESPHLSVLLSGTRNQVNKLIDSVENGLFSRFLFYDFTAKVEWRDMFSWGEFTRKKLFDSYSKYLLDCWLKAEASGEVVFIPTMEDRKFVTSYYSQKLTELYSIYGDDIVANVKRTCIMYYRIAMILSTLHHLDSPTSNREKIPNQLYLNTQQSRCAFLIVDTLLTHLEFVYTRMQNTGALAKLNPQQRSIFEALPKEFTWAEFKSAAEEIGIRYGTVEKYRRDLIKSKLILSIEHGKYRKN
jgi:hypothetical protein